MNKKEKLQEYALIAEIIGGVAIVCSLIFVGLQIRQNSRISSVNAYQELIAQISIMNSLRIQDPGFADLYWRFDHGQQPATDEERARLEAFLFMVYRQGDLAYREQGRFDDARTAYEQALKTDPGLIEVNLNLGILYDLYLQDAARALEYYERYQTLASARDKTVDLWITDLKQRMPVAAEVQP